MSEDTTTHSNLATEISVKQVMRTTTKAMHTIADNKIQTMLFKKKLSLDGYKIYLAQLYFLYEVLEEELAKHKDHPFVGAIHFPDELTRLEALGRDLKFFLGEDWESQLVCVAGMEDYVNHLRQLSREEPSLLVPHSYVRYFGDLSGGQILSKVFRRLYSLPEDGSGVQFYNFGHLESIPHFKELYSNRLNSLDLSLELRGRFAEEAKKSFELNIRWIEDSDKLAESMPNGYLSKESHTSDPTHIQDLLTENKIIVSGAKNPISKEDKFTYVIWLASFVVMISAGLAVAFPWIQRTLSLESAFN